MRSDGMRGAAGTDRQTAVQCAGCREVVLTLGPGEHVARRGEPSEERPAACTCGQTRSVRVARDR